jgi:dTDP-4-amino-4,6-dideoxygalactose transaminase
MAQQYMASLTFSTPFFLNSVFRADFLHIRTRSVPHPCDFFLAQEWESTNLNSLGYKEGSFPEAERAAREVLALPTFPELREDEQQTVVSAIVEFLS